MMHMKKKSNFILQLLLVTLSTMVMFLVTSHPVQAGISNRMIFFSISPLTRFEGYYQLDEDKDQYLQIIVKNDKLVLKQLWDQREITFEQKSDLYFYNEELKFPLTFSKDANGEISQVLAFEHDTWIKVNDYKPVEKKSITLPAKTMQGYAGKYKHSHDDHELFLQFTVVGNSLEVKELWRGTIYTIVPESELVFFAKNGHYPVQFTKDKVGNVTQALIFNRDVWEKVKE
jgi:hypothetical protein